MATRSGGRQGISAKLANNTTLANGHSYPGSTIARSDKEDLPEERVKEYFSKVKEYDSSINRLEGEGKLRSFFTQVRKKKADEISIVDEYEALVKKHKPKLPELFLPNTSYRVLDYPGGTTSTIASIASSGKDSMHSIHTRSAPRRGVILNPLPANKVSKLDPESAEHARFRTLSDSILMFGNQKPKEKQQYGFSRTTNVVEGKPSDFNESDSPIILDHYPVSNESLNSQEAEPATSQPVRKSLLAKSSKPESKKQIVEEEPEDIKPREQPKKRVNKEKQDEILRRAKIEEEEIIRRAANRNFSEDQPIKPTTKNKKPIVEEQNDKQEETFEEEAPKKPTRQELQMKQDDSKRKPPKMPEPSKSEMKPARIPDIKKQKAAEIKPAPEEEEPKEVHPPFGKNDKRIECQYCGRRFDEERIEKHETVCFKSKQPRRKYDAAAARLRGTEMDPTKQKVRTDIFQ